MREEFVPEDLDTSITDLAALIGIRRGFLMDLLLVEANDWSFVIKAHALLESVVCQLIGAHLQRPSLDAVLAQRVQMEDRIEMLKALDLVDGADRTMMRLLGKIRNHLVHNVQQTDFTFAEYFANRDNRRNFVEAFGRNWPDPVAGGTSREQFVVANPRLVVWMSLMEVIIATLKAKGAAEGAARLDALRRERIWALSNAAGKRRRKAAAGADGRSTRSGPA
jgi:hypothetical protein